MFMFMILFELIILSDLITLTNTISLIESQEPQDNFKIIYESFNDIINLTYEVVNFLTDCSVKNKIIFNLIVIFHFLSVCGIKLIMLDCVIQW